MNNTKTLAIVAVLTAATLVIGLTVAATMTTSAFAWKKDGQDKYMRGGQDDSKKDGQDKYMRGGQDDSKKDGQDTYNKGTRDNGNDGGSGNQNGNTVTILKAQNKGFASGFDTAVNQEAENTICTHPSTNCIAEGSETSSTDATGGGSGGGEGNG
jgi:hypothetical protein